MDKTIETGNIKPVYKTRDYVLNITLMGLMTALICVLAPLSIQLPGQVPISLTLMAIYFTVYLLGGAKGTVCVVLYLLRFLYPAVLPQNCRSHRRYLPPPAGCRR